MSARDEILRHPGVLATADAEINTLLDRYRADTRREVLGDDLNPSVLVLDAQAYRRLADDIAATMTDPDRWDGDEPEDMVLGRYVKWLAAGRAQVRAEVLTEVSRLFEDRGRALLDGGIMTAADAAELIRQHAVGQAGKDTRGAVQASAGESTQPAASCPGFKAGDLCTLCGDARRWHRSSAGEVAQSADRIVAYRNVIRRGLLLCREHGNGLQGSIPLTSEDLPDGGICTDCGADVLIDPKPFIPRTEREYWVDIADALNAAAGAGMPVGIDIEGILTDHNAWVVVWNRADERWEVGGYDDEPPTEAPDPDRWLSCSRTRPSCPNAERARYAVERGWTADGRAGDWLCAEHAPTDFFRPRRSYQRGRWTFTCLAIAPRPWDGETRAVGYLSRNDGTGTETALGQRDWTDAGWAEVAEGGESRG